MDHHKPVLGTTLYSFTHEWKARSFTLEKLIATVAENNLGPGVEIVGFQSFRGFPDVTDEYADQFRSLLEEHGLIASCLGGNIDVGRHPERAMTENEILEYIERQVISARKLGFPVLRIQAFVGPAVFEKLAPIAEKAQVHIACELHAPLTSDHPVVTSLIECYDRVGTPYLGFVPDFSSAMLHPPDVHWQSLRKSGVPDALIDITQENWHSKKSAGEKFSTLREAADRFNLDRAHLGALNRSLTMFGNMPVAMLKDLLPYTRHIHGKFYHVNEEGVEPSIPYPQIFGVLKEANFHGTISAEWEGHAFTREMIGLQEVRAWHSMCNRLLEK